MGEGLSTFFGKIYDAAIPLFCGSDHVDAIQLGLADWQFAAAKAALFLIFLLPAILAWYRSWNRLRRNGFNKRFWRIGLWFLVAITTIQVAEILLVPVTGGIVPCPYDTFVIAAITILALYGLYCFHLGAANKGTFSQFLMLVVGPLFGEAVVNSREIGTSGAKLLVRALEAIGSVASHLYALIHV